MSARTVEKDIKDYIQHIRRVVATFNAEAERCELDIRMDASNAIAAVKMGVGLSTVMAFSSREDDSGIIHEAQLVTFVRCLVEFIRDAHRCGHIVGAMQSGKTTTALALQWAGPALYLLNGKKACPFYIIGNQTSHEDQTTTELRRFLSYYGHIELRLTNNKVPATLDPVFTRSSSLLTYREHVLRGTFKDVYEVPQLDDLVFRRVGGERGIHKIVDLCGRAVDNGFRPLMLIDEPQFGASDRMVIDGDNAQGQRQTCVLAQIFNKIENKLGSSRKDHWFVGLSATPFELNDLSRVWEVRQSLTKEYSGYNFFNGKPISPGVDVTPPISMGLSEFGTQLSKPFMGNMSMSAYSKDGASFSRFARKIGFSGDHDAYQGTLESTLKQAIYATLSNYAADPEWPVGLCIRAFNDNARTNDLIARLKLDPKRVEVITYYGAQDGGASVKRAINRRSRPDLPFIVFVTNRARMADAFPTRVRFFMDLAAKTGDLNALLQGVVGRACGYGKKSTVVLSDANAGILDLYVATQGGYVAKPSRHVQTVGGFRRGAPTGMIKLRSDMDDRVVQRFLQGIDQKIVAKNVLDGSTCLKGAKRSGGKVGASFRTGPVLKIADELRLFDHIEKPSVRAVLFPQIPTGFKVARATDAIRHKRGSNVMIGYSLDENGDCRFTFRWSSRDDAARGGGKGRAKGKKDTDLHMEPTIYVEKFDPRTGKIIDDRKTPAARQKAGSWRAFMVTFPLREPVSEVVPAELALPNALCAYDDWLEKPERKQRDIAALMPKSSGFAAFRRTRRANS